jgi:hypothetical protein
MQGDGLVGDASAPNVDPCVTPWPIGCAVAHVSFATGSTVT